MVSFARARRLGVCAPLLLALAAPASAQAHGLFLTPNFSIPVWLFAAAGGIVLAVSFVALGALWRQQLLDDRGWRPVLPRLGRWMTSRPAEIVCGACGVALLGLVIYAGFAGAQESDDNVATVLVFVIFWVGLVPVSALFGDVFRAFNPWRAVGRAAAWLDRRLGAPPGLAAATPPFPGRLGRIPAVVGLMAFVILELASNRTPRAVATAAAIYSLVTFAAMVRFGVEAWCERGETFSVYFNLFSRVSVLEVRGRRLGLRRPLSALADLDRLPGTVLMVCAMIGTVSYDGFSDTAPWQAVLRRAISIAGDVGVGPITAGRIATVLGLTAATFAIYGFYRLGLLGAHHLDRRIDGARLASAFVPSLVPIALAYVVAHYTSFLLIAGQSIAAVASDPLGRGTDLFGTAQIEPNVDILSPEGFWAIEVGAIVIGHVAGLMLAHDLALGVYDRTRIALRSQRWMLAIMIGFTLFALWLLAQSSELG